MMRHNFSAGANVGMIFMLAVEQEYDEMDMAITDVPANDDACTLFGNSGGGCAAWPEPGGGCEMCLHADKVMAAAETYIGLVELGIGLIPGGGGTKEFVLRACR